MPKLNKLRFILAHPKESIEFARNKTHAYRCIGSFPVQADIPKISSGISPLEKEFASYRDKLPQLGNDFGPIDLVYEQTIDTELEKWLDDRSAQEILYVSFGSVLSAEEDILFRLAQGLLATERPIIWALDNESRTKLETSISLDTFCIRPFFPQSTLLKRENIKIFITHAGLGGVQDGILSKTPMLCIPFMTDQLYNSVSVCEMGIGLRINKDELQPQKIRDKTLKLLKSQEMRNNIEKMSNYIASNSPANKITSYVFDMLRN